MDYNPNASQSLRSLGRSEPLVLAIGQKFAGFLCSFWYVECLPTAKKGVYIPRMSKPNRRYQNRTELLQGTLDMLILETLQWAPRHGYALSKAIRTNSGEILKVDTGSLYPALHRLERKGWIAAEWKPSELGPRLRVYRLTEAGRKQLVSERSRWERLVTAIAGILNANKKEDVP